MPLPGIEPTICRSRVRRPNHYTTEPLIGSRGGVVVVVVFIIQTVLRETKSVYFVQCGSTPAFWCRHSEDPLFPGSVPQHDSTSRRSTTFSFSVWFKVTTFDTAEVTQPLSQLTIQLFLRAFQKYADLWSNVQGWQVSANISLNRGLNQFKPSWQKQVFAGFYQT